MSNPIDPQNQSSDPDNDPDHDWDHNRMDSPQGSKANLMTLCASHISSISRFRKLQQLLSSCAKQTANWRLFLMISFEPHLEHLIPSLSSKFERYGPHLMVIITDNPGTQFQHYRRALELIYQSRLVYDLERLWIDFTDDDDLWHPHRYLKHNEYVSYFHPKSEIGVFMIEQDIVTHINDQKGQKIYGTAEAVTQALIRGELGHSKPYDQQRLGYYTQYVFRATFLKAFFDHYGLDVDFNPFCDRLLVAFTHRQNRYHIAICEYMGGTPEDPHWSYYHRKHKDQLSNHYLEYLQKHYSPLISQIKALDPVNLGPRAISLTSRILLYMVSLQAPEEYTPERLFSSWILFLEITKDKMWDKVKEHVVAHKEEFIQLFGQDLFESYRMAPGWAKLPALPSQRSNPSAGPHVRPY